MFTIGLDFDGVLSRIDTLVEIGMLDVLNRRIPRERARYEFLIDDGHATHDEYWEVIHQICRKDEYIPYMTPVEGMQTYLPRVLNVFHPTKATVITARRHPEGSGLAERWLKKLSINLPVIGVNTDKESRCKSEFVSGYDVFVDDDPENLLVMAKIVPHRYLFRWHYNKNDPVPEGVIPVDSWRELHDHICAIARTHAPS
jgi:5'(3')-deoxyribonucleotidase